MTLFILFVIYSWPNDPMIKPWPRYDQNFWVIAEFNQQAYDQKVSVLWK